jgi:hypothetical protein
MYSFGLCIKLNVVLSFRLNNLHVRTMWYEKTCNVCYSVLIISLKFVFKAEVIV